MTPEPIAGVDDEPLLEVDRRLIASYSEQPQAEVDVELARQAMLQMVAEEPW